MFRQVHQPLEDFEDYVLTPDHSCQISFPGRPPFPKVSLVVTHFPPLHEPGFPYRCGDWGLASVEAR